MAEGLLLATLVALPAAAWSLHFAWWRRTVSYDRPRVLMYHMVREPIPGTRFNKLRVPPRSFERQLQWLADNDWSFCFVKDLATAGPKTVAITFDDGYADNWAVADPLLARFGAVATLYLVVDRFDRDWSTTKKAHHDSGELMRELKLGNDDVRAMIDSGRWEIGAHTLTHALLPALPDDEERHEIQQSKNSIEETFGVGVESFAYPFGILDPRDTHTVAAAGYRYAVTTAQGIPSDVTAQAMVLPRIKVSGTEGIFAFALRIRTGRRGVFS